MKPNTTLCVVVAFAILACWTSDLSAAKYLKPSGEETSQVWWGNFVDMGTTGILHWGDMDVDWYFTGDVPGGVDPNDARDEVQASFDTWENVTTADIDFTYVNDTSRTWANDGYNVFYWTYEDEDGVYEDVGFNSNILGVTIVSFDGSSHEFGDVDIALNGEDITWSTDGSPGSGEHDLRAVATHEIGHMVGLGHVIYAGLTMYPYYSFGQRTLEEDDEIGVSFVCGGNLIESTELYNAAFDWSVTVLTGNVLYLRGGLLEFYNGSSLTISNSAALLADIYYPYDSVEFDFKSYGVYRGIHVEPGGGIGLEDTEIYNSYYGIRAEDPNYIDIRDCYIHDCNYAISITDCDTDPNVIDTEITDNTYGLTFFDSNGTVTGCTIDDNDEIGVTVMYGTGPTCNYNSIAGNGNRAMTALWNEGNVDAENNWWGTDAPDEDTYLIMGNVDYDPWLMSAP